MATPTMIFLALAIFLQGALGELVCDELPTALCSFSIASSGRRCVLETSGGAPARLQCKTSQVMATNMKEYIESEECVDACGVDRDSVGISSDSLLEAGFARKLCSAQCYDNCPNIVDLYSNLAQAEGVLLPELCKNQGSSSHRVMFQLQSSAAVKYGSVSAPAYAPISARTDSSLDCAPAPI
ncbi:uncharacterized protein LOC127252109 [Andrographis paniculata]|uniref:uncharacterized protein LOC127252109 n=1 Tax=Andrographis paniculata TaxID=175694 RepID=UPI0021E88871|nr:uncharacterized protein LOC127252109 [Andrographis paniculata]